MLGGLLCIVLLCFDHNLIQVCITCSLVCNYVSHEKCMSLVMVNCLHLQAEKILVRFRVVANILIKKINFFNYRNMFLTNGLVRKTRRGRNGAMYAGREYMARYSSVAVRKR